MDSRIKPEDENLNVCSQWDYSACTQRREDAIFLSIGKHWRVILFAFFTFSGECLLAEFL